jgi:hypothetical protein
MLHRRQRRRSICSAGGFRSFDHSIPTPILALLAAVKLAAIINSPADAIGIRDMFDGSTE